MVYCEAKPECEPSCNLYKEGKATATTFLF